ncbi:MAG: AraC family transcriptional regulator [Sandaracinus sp.]|nr:AraC family transcriptional regulator [Sandaracinus sp.]
MADWRVRRDDDVLWVQGAMHDNAEHAHHALQLVFARKPAKVESPSGTVEACAIAIEGGSPHRLELEDGLVALVEAESVVARALRAGPLVAATIVALAPPDREPTLENADAILRALAPTDSVKPLDPRLRRVLVWLGQLETEGNLRDAELAGALAKTRLSESRFLHLFTEQVGTPWRRYLVWRRALHAMERALAGASLTEAAHAAGYADGAHLSRQFRELFGYTPSASLRRFTR